MLSCFLVFTPVVADTELELYYAQYQDNDNLEVSSPTVSVLHWLNDFFSFKARYNYEKFEKSASGGGSANLDAISGATTVVGGSGSGFEESRKEYSVVFGYKNGDWTSSLGSMKSDEENFESISLMAGVGREFFNKNFSVNLNYAFTSDKITVNNQQTGIANEEKATHSFSLGASQLLSPTKVLSFGVGTAYIDGYQSGPLRKISVDQLTGSSLISYIYDERHPDYRERYLLYTQYKQYFLSRTALTVNVSGYRDDWGVSAIALEPTIAQYLHDNIRLRLRYRYYRQSSSEFYESNYSEEQDIMTADKRLRPFNSQVFGINLSYSSNNFASQRWVVTLGFNHYRESNQGLNANLFSISTKYKF